MIEPCRCRSSALREVGRRLSLVLAMGLWLAGCTPGLLQRADTQADHTYFIEWQGDRAVPPAPASGPDLLIGSMLAAPGFDGSEMAYVRKPHEIEYFAHHRWVDAPARMLEPLLLRAARQTGLFRSVVSPGSRAGAALRLDSRLLHLRQVWLAGSSELQLGVRVTLVEIANGRVLGEQVIEVNESLDELSPYGGVQAADRAVAVLMTRVQEFLGERVKARQR